MAHFSDSDLKSLSQNQSSLRQGSVGSNSLLRQQEEAFSTPCIKPAPGSFVARGANYSRAWDCGSSPMPDAFNNVADEDEWVKMNKGFIADLDSLHMTPACKVRSLSSDGNSPGFSKSTYEQEIQNLKKHMELAIKERDELKVLLNEHLVEEIGKLQEEVQLARKVPHDIHEYVTTCKDIHMDVLSIIQSSVIDEKSFAKYLLSSMSEIGSNLFSTLEMQCTKAINGERTLSKDDSLLQDQCKYLCETLNSMVALSASSEIHSSAAKELESNQHGLSYKVLDFMGDSAPWKETLSNELKTTRENYICIEKPKCWKILKQGTLTWKDSSFF